MSNTQIGRTPVKTLVSQPFRMRTLKGCVSEVNPRDWTTISGVLL